MTRTRRTLAAVVLAAAATLAQPAAAWNGHGHMLVAAVAWRKMQPASRTKVAELLKLNPMYPQWIAGVPAADRDAFAFQRAATWPDSIRGKTCPNKAKDPQPTPPNTGDQVWHGPLKSLCYIDDGPPSAPSPHLGRNLGYEDMRLHRYWHFKDIGFSTDGTAVEAPEAPNAGTQIAALRDALKTGSNSRKSYDVVWLAHLVGDVHQPLHAAARFSKATPHGDRGGNSVLVCAGAGVCKASNAGALHSFWDGALGSGESPVAIRAEAARLCDATGVKLKLCDAPTPGAEDVADVEAWITESAGLAQARVYAKPIGPGVGPYKVSEAYRVDAARVARGQIVLAGARLAKLLDAALLE